MCLGIPGQVKEIYAANGVRMGTVDFAGITKDGLPGLRAGDCRRRLHHRTRRLCHHAARRSLGAGVAALFEEMGVLEEELRET
jgi:hypothetical protein